MNTPRRLTLLVAIVVLAAICGVGLAAAAGGTPDAGDAGEWDADSVQSDLQDGESPVQSGRQDGESAVDPAAGGAGASPTATGRIEVESTLRQDSEAGMFGVTTAATIPDRVTELRVTLPERAVDVEGDGFDHDEGTTWRWDGSTDDPTLSYRLPANRTIDREGPIAGPGEYLFVDAGDWALVQPPGVGLQWRSAGSVRASRSNAVEGEGVASDAIAFLGPYEEHTHEAHGQEFRLIVPDAAEMTESPDDVFEHLTYASGALQVGDRDPQVFVVAAPTGDVQWGVRGLQAGPADMWVRDNERLADANNVWIHEYVHTRQGYRAEASARWITEATATYYAALLTLERGDVGFDAFRDVLRRGERDPQAASLLNDPDTWRNHADYTKGSLVAAEIDRRIRLATDGEKTLATVFREVNAQGEPITDETLLRLVEEAGGADVRDAAERYTATSERPTSWDHERHDEAFGTLPARIGFSIADADAVRATGDYRNRAVQRDPVILVVGETLELDVTVTNTGGVAGEYDVSLVLDGETVDARDGRVEANGSVVERFEHAFTEPGEYDLRVGGTAVPVEVHDPADPELVALEVTPDTVDAGDSVTVRATYVNGDAIPAETEVEISVDGEVVHVGTLRMDADAEASYETEVELREAGDVTLSVGDRSRSVAVGPPAGATDDDSPGFGAVAAAVALVSAALIARRRGRG